jgi:two-component system phosphate regulon sensor histidine kinase PhoR
VIWYFKRAILHERALESTKNEFLSLASHQLRTPATNVKQYIGLLLDGYMGNLTEQQRQALVVAYRNNEAEISIMNNLLDVAKLDLDRIQLHKKVVNVTKIAKHVVQDSKSQAMERKQTLKLEGPKQVMASVDDEYVRGVIENLVDNAIKYSKEKTKIMVTVAREQDFVCIVVKDQGLGIRKRDYGKLFNKFTRLDNEFSANSEGSGLGLYWVKKIVELHGGTIDVTSREGRGSTFTVRLPIR